MMHKLIHVSVRELTLISFGALALLFLGAWASFYPSASQQKYIAQNCPTYVPHARTTATVRFIDCRGIIGIEKYYDEDFLTVFNGRYPDAEEWEAFNVWNYKIVGDELLYIEDPKLRINSGTIYKMATEGWPNQVATLSKYREVNTKSGQFTLYKTLEQVPQGERVIFEQLESTSPEIQQKSLVN